MVVLMIGITAIFLNFNVAIQDKYNNKFFHDNLDSDPVAKYLYENSENKKNKGN